MEEPKQPDPEPEPELPTEEAPTFAQPPTTPAAASDLSDVEELEPFKPKTPAAADDLSDVEELEPEPAKPAPAKPATPPQRRLHAIGARVEARFQWRRRLVSRENLRGTPRRHLLRQI